MGHVITILTPVPFPVNNRKRMHLAVSIPRGKYRSLSIARSHRGKKGWKSEHGYHEDRGYPRIVSR